MMRTPSILLTRRFLVTLAGVFLLAVGSTNYLRAWALEAGDAGSGPIQLGGLDDEVKNKIDKLKDKIKDPPRGGGAPEIDSPRGGGAPEISDPPRGGGAPEISPGVAAGTLALLLGGVAILTARRRRR